MVYVPPSRRGYERKTTDRVRIKVFMKFLIMAFLACDFVTPMRGASIPEPVHRIDATKFGFTPAYFEPNRVFFRDYTLARLMAADPESKLIMLSENIAVLYATRPADGIHTHKPDCLQAFFIDVSSGKLLRKQEWHVRTRQLDSDRLDSEARILPLSSGRYFVMADGKMHVYDADGEATRAEVLSDGIWAAKSVSNGDIIVLRHSQWPGYLAVEYEWLDSTTLNVLRRFEETDNARARMPYSAASRSVTYELRDGLHEVMPDGADRLICADPMCRFPANANWEVLGRPSQERVLLVSPQGLLVALAEDGRLWSRMTGYPGTGPVNVHIALLEISRKGNRFILGLNGKHKTFDGVPLQGNWQYFIYDLATRAPVLIVPQLSVNGDVHEALSPTGKRFLTFDGRSIRVYELP